MAGRQATLESVAVALDRIRSGRHAQSAILIGLRGVGETVLLNRMRRAAEGEGMIAVPIEAPEGQSLPAMLVPALRSALLKPNRGPSRHDNSKTKAGRACALR